MNISHLNDWQYGRVYDITTDPKRAKQVLKRKPRSRMIASECISIMPDGTRKLIAGKAKVRNVAGVKRRVTTKSDTSNYFDRVARFGAVGVGE